MRYEVPLEVQKDRKHYKMLQKQKCLAKKLRLNKVNANNKLKRAMIADISPQTALPAAVFLHESVPVSPAAIPLFLVC